MYICTDMEGCAGVLGFDDFTNPGAPYYLLARELATLEAAACAEGCLEAGAREVLILDGHGAGAMDIRLLPRGVRLIAGRPMGYPFGLDPSFDAMMFVGQHAKAGTEAAHLCHTGDQQQIDLAINGVSVGELGAFAALAGSMGVPTVFVAGDAACCDEARALIPGVETACVKYGLSRHVAVHLQPEDARDCIRAGAARAMARAQTIAPLVLGPPYTVVSVRPGPAGEPDRTNTVTSYDLLEALRRI